MEWNKERPFGGGVRLHNLPQKFSILFDSLNIFRYFSTMA